MQSVASALDASPLGKLFVGEEAELTEGEAIADAELELRRNEARWRER